MRISVEQELLRDTLWQELEKCGGRLSQVARDVFADVSLKLTADELVNLSDQDGHLRDELDESLRHEDDTVVLAELSTLHDNVCHLGSNLGQGLVLGFDFLANQAAVNASSQGALQSNMRG